MAKVKSIYPGVPYGGSLTAITKELDSVRTKEDLKGKFDLISRELERILGDTNAPNEETRRIALTLTERLEGYRRGGIGRVASQSPSKPYNSEQYVPPGNAVDSGLVAMARKVYESHEALLTKGMLYTEEGIRWARNLTGRIIEALENGRDVEALRIANYFASKYIEYTVGSSPTTDAERKLMEELNTQCGYFCELKDEISSRRGISIHSNGKPSTFILNLDPKTSVTDVAIAIDELGGYFAPKMWGGDKVWINLHFEGPPYAAVKIHQPGKFEVSLYETPLKPVNEKSLTERLQPTA